VGARLADRLAKDLPERRAEVGSLPADLADLGGHGLREARLVERDEPPRAGWRQ
jgi:hypothetical protein